jgi:predicted RNase H-like nuclease (RuvC/YqgF family)
MEDTGFAAFGAEETGGVETYSERLRRDIEALKAEGRELSKTSESIRDYFENKTKRIEARLAERERVIEALEVALVSALKLE